MTHLSTRNDIEKRIELEKQKIHELRIQIEIIESFIKGLQEALKMLPDKDEMENRKTTKLRTASGIRSGSNVEKVFNLLRQTGEPMHISAILAGIGQENNKANRLSLSSTLSKYVRKNLLFDRPIPNSFSLKETKGNSVSITDLS